MSSSGNSFVVKDLNLDHNHICTKELYDTLPRNRKLDEDISKEVAELHELGVSNKVIQAKFHNETAKQITSKDISNIAAAFTVKGSDDLKKSISLLTETYGADCRIYKDDNQLFQGLFFATNSMKKIMTAYPEIVFIDATYKVLKIRAALYLMLVEDSAGSSEIIGICILMSEDFDSVTWMMETFKEIHHSAWKNIKCFMSDKDMVERNVIKNCLPHVKLKICVYHTLRTFNREISSAKRGITTEQRSEALRILQKMVYSTTNEEYENLYEELKLLPESIVNYLDENWSHIKDEWVLSTDFFRDSFYNTTNNRTESINSKVKSVVKTHSFLEDFIRQFFKLITSQRIERNHEAAYSQLKTPIVQYKANSPEKFYIDLLTLYAFQVVLRELEKRNEVDLEAPIGNTYKSTYKGLMIETNDSKCTCIQYESWRLPCRHIFAVRMIEKLDLKDEKLVAERWTKQYYAKQFMDTHVENKITGLYELDTLLVKQKTLSSHQKYRETFILSNKLASLASEKTGNDYNVRKEELKVFVEHWERDTNIREEELIVGSETLFNLVREILLLTSTATGLEGSTRLNQLQELVNLWKKCNDDDNLSEEIKDKINEANASDTCNILMLRGNYKTKKCTPANSSVEIFENNNNSHLEGITLNTNSTEIFKNDQDVDLKENSSNCSSFSKTEVLWETCVDTENKLNEKEEYRILAQANDYDDFSLNLETELHIPPPSEYSRLQPTIISNISLPEEQKIIFDKNKSLKLTFKKFEKLAIIDEEDSLLTINESEINENHDLNVADPFSGADEKDKFLGLLDGIVMPPPLKTKGRPKGLKNCVIGIPRKAQARKANEPKSKKPEVFSKQPVLEQYKKILNWIVGEEVTNRVLFNKYRILLSDVNGCELLPYEVIDENINLEAVKKFFSDDAWKAVINLYENTKKKVIWKCRKCSEELGNLPSVGCESCLGWFHRKCTTIRREPKIFICSFCKIVHEEFN